MRDHSRIVQCVRVVALVVMIGGYIAFVRANNAEASAIFDADGDAGMWGVGIIFATALLIPGVVLSLLSLAVALRAKRSDVIGVVAGVALLAPTAWLGMNIYPPDKETDEGSPLDPAQWEHVSDLYLVAFLLIGAAGALLLISAFPAVGRRGSENDSTSCNGCQSPEPGSAHDRPLIMRRSSLVLGTSLLALAVLPYPQPRATASCAPPYLDVAGSLERGASATIKGQAFVDGCHDSEGCSLGCGGCEPDDPEPRPYDDIELRLVQRGHTWHLAVADAGRAEDDELGRVTWTFRVPEDAQPGPARLATDPSGTVQITIR